MIWNITGLQRNCRQDCIPVLLWSHDDCSCCV